MTKNKKQFEGGQAMIVATIFFLIISITIIFGLAVPVAKQKHIVADLIGSRDSYFISEAAMEDVVYRLKNGLSVGTTQTLQMNGQSATVTTTTAGSGRTLTSVGTWNGLQRQIETKLKVGVGVAFGYGIQVGNGGFNMSGGSGVNGSVASNGPIVGSGGAFITGTVSSSGASGSISGVTVGSSTALTGDAWANSVTGSTVRGNLYCQTGSGNNKACNTSKGIPPADPFPVTSTDISTWQGEASAGGVFVGNKTISGTATILGPLKINGNLIVSGNVKLTVSGTLWVTGNITIDNGGSIVLASSYGTNSGVIVSDGKIYLANNSNVSGSGTSGSYVLLLTTSDCPTSVSCGGAPAIDVSNNTGLVIMNAQNGTIQFNNNDTAQEATAKRITLANNAIIDYKTGLINTTFSNGPTGGWDIQSWKEK